MVVELLDYMGSDLTVVNAARVSFNKQHDKVDKIPSEAQPLVTICTLFCAVQDSSSNLRSQAAWEAPGWS